MLPLQRLRAWSLKKSLVLWCLRFDCSLSCEVGIGVHSTRWPGFISKTSFPIQSSFFFLFLSFSFVLCLVSLAHRMLNAATSTLHSFQSYKCEKLRPAHALRACAKALRMALQLMMARSSAIFFKFFKIYLFIYFTIELYELFVYFED